MFVLFINKNLSAPWTKLWAFADGIGQDQTALTNEVRNKERNE